ncbi:relaxin-3 isoform X1 [Ahaetulla prasina]|uniref:relaxin-3 isoform X1 n=1 Tax=Ahaetulla prasina TaxID=499056 RepID=UPI0026477D22|nr:relaxin-3 isoform X1 [Ahaetulla prasina]
MPKFLLALVLGVLLSEKWLVSEARTPTYGVKLCGREFIRAVIFTCGGSRWRRAENAAIQPLLTFFPSSEKMLEILRLKLCLKKEILVLSLGEILQKHLMQHHYPMNGIQSIPPNRIPLTIMGVGKVGRAMPSPKSPGLWIAEPEMLWKA